MPEKEGNKFPHVFKCNSYIRFLVSINIYIRPTQYYKNQIIVDGSLYIFIFIYM